ncbi:MAG: hypothetical protein PHH61_02920 [Candidatus Nanoarchaeia archaeon]|nr:hypothetical protein [Candidatus Nanoarchaeia archaeon]
MAKYTYLLLGALIVGLFTVWAVLNFVEAPIAERANLPRCNSGVIIDSELKYNIILYGNERIIQGTGESYFNNHFIYKNIDYSIADCTFIVRYEYTYDEYHTNMDITAKAISSDKFEIINTNTFMRPVNILVDSDEAIQIAVAQNISYSYYNLDIDIEQQSFKYKFFRDTITEGSQLVLIVDAQSKEIVIPKIIKSVTPLV